jgi:hypothetical protein
VIEDAVELRPIDELTAERCPLSRVLLIDPIQALREPRCEPSFYLDAKVPATPTVLIVLFHGRSIPHDQGI